MKIKWQVRCCSSCGFQLLPVGLFFDKAPGYRCQCSWGTLTKREFLDTFGIAFSQTRPVKPVKSAWVYSVNLPGNAHDRRKALRAGKGVVTNM